MSKKTIKTISEESIPAVMEYLDELNMLRAFKEANQQMFDTYSVLAERVNRLRVDADKAVRALGVNCGPWSVMSTAVKYDTNKLLELVGPKRFEELGGKATPTTIYTMDKQAIEVAIAKKLIGDDLLEEIKDESVRYSAPKDL